MTVNIENRWPENSDAFLEKLLWGTIFEKEYFQLSRIYSFRENEKKLK